MDSPERRQFTRLNTVITVEIRDGRGFSLHPTHDLSIGGMYFDRAIPHAVGSKVDLSFQLPGDERSIRCAGEVANVPNANGYGMGLRFLDLSKEDATRIDDFLHELRESA